MTTSKDTGHPFAELLGFSVVERGDGRCVVELELDEHHRNPHGIIHGGVLYSLADTSMGGAVTSTLDDAEICTTIEIKIAYFRPATGGLLRARSEVVNRGRKTASLETSLELGDRVLARAYGTFMILPRAQ